VRGENQCPRILSQEATRLLVFRFRRREDTYFPIRDCIEELEGGKQLSRFLQVFVSKAEDEIHSLLWKVENGIPPTGWISDVRERLVSCLDFHFLSLD